MAVQLLLCVILVAGYTHGESEPEMCKACNFNKVTEQLARQLALQRLYIEERIRSDGGSGIKQIRVTRKGTRPYHATSYTGNRIVAVHEHSNNIRVVGLGEFIAVLNGVEFRTRHNDYKLVMPHRTEGGYEAVEDIPFPEVPPAVRALPTVEKQITEMREWFKAWRDQDYSVRDYRPYFKPVLCYLEGAWTLPNGDAIDESFDSDRHSIDATSWFDLQEKIKFTSYTGKKDKDENYAYLPTTIIKVLTNGTVQLVIAQWNYRILCHPLSRDLPTSRLRVIDDLQSRMAYLTSVEKHSMSRAARFQVNPYDSSEWKERWVNGQLIDELMNEIPGKDNEIGDLTDDALGSTAKKYGSTGPVNAAYYHSWFTGDKDAMGSSVQRRGYADESLYMAMTSQGKVAPMSVEKCVKVNGKKKCTTYTQRWSYAIPLEIIYLTPLYNWNPHNIDYKGFFKSEDGNTVFADGRDGSHSLKKAYNGTNNNKFYRTPSGFFTDDKGSGDKADTAGGIKSALNKNGDMHDVIASGTRILLPNIPGVGALRVRYPIMPTHAEGSATWKELDALKDLLLHPNTYRKMSYYYEDDEPEAEIQPLKTSVANDEGKSHVHFLLLTRENVDDMNAGLVNYNVTVETTKDPTDGHFHKLTIYRNKYGNFMYSACDGRRTCKDGHKWRMYCTPTLSKCMV